MNVPDRQARSAAATGAAAVPVAPLPDLRVLRSTWRYGRVPLIEPLLEARIVPREWPLGRVDGVIGWGRKITGQRAVALARRLGVPYLLAEDGFLRSVGLGHADAALSIVLDDVGVYYDARSPSRLEALIRAGHDASQTERASRFAAAWCAGRVSKYNHAREVPGLLADGDVLVVDQTAGDSSIACGLADASSFHRMLEAALDEHPQSRIVLKVHPDVIAGRKRGHYQQLSAGQSSRVLVQAADTHPPSLFEKARAVYVVTSQMGFEALLWGKQVRCFGMPFYAGWGLTDDDLPAPRRRGTASLESLVHAALIDYPRYLDPETMRRCEPERLLEWMALQRRQRERFPQDVYAVGFGGSRRPLATAFFAGSRVHFLDATHRAPEGACVAAWTHCAANRVDPTPAIRVAAGLLHPPGADAALVASLSWLMDRSASAQHGQALSDLEALLADRAFDAALLGRARRLRERLAEALPQVPAGHAWQRPPGARPVLLVAGDPGMDPQPLLTAVRAEAPHAHLVYRPDPQEYPSSRERSRSAVRALCDAIVDGGPLHPLLEQIDAVHTMQSPVGFQALLHGRRVVCHGSPFYAGWGLTEDRLPMPRRRRRLSLEELVAGALILYPTYISRETRHFTTPERVLDELHALPATSPSRFAALRHWLDAAVTVRSRLRRT